MYRLYILKTNKNARTICALCVNSTGENINAINGITKALPYTKEMKTAYRELKECVTTAQSQLGRKKAEFNQHL